MSALGAVGPVAAPTGMLGIFQNLLTGFPLSGMFGYITLLFLTVFPVTGIVGLNLIAVGEPITAFLKLISVGISLILMTFLAPYLPLFIQGDWLLWVAGLGPWYIFDVLQMIEFNDFNKNGFVSLISIAPSGGGKGGNWRLTSTFVNLFLATLAGSGQLLPALFPDVSIGGVSGSSIGNWTSIISGSALGVSAVGSLAAVALGPSVAPASVVVAVGPQLGGASSIPTLTEMMDTLSKTTYPVQAGGAMTPSDKIFLSVLGFVAVVGISMGFARSKQ
jgi:hypothetical protein